jgi:hypothetical protein
MNPKEEQEMTPRKNNRKALKALALGFAAAAIFTTTASAKVMGVFPAQSAEISYLSWGATADDLGPFAAQQAPTFSRITSAAELYAGQLEPGQAEIPYLSWGATADDLGPFKQSVVDRTKLPDGGVYDYSSDNSVAAAARSASVAVSGTTPTNLARAYHPIEQGVARPDGYQPQLQGDEQVIIRDKPDGFQPQTKVVESATVSASSDGLDRGDLALGFGLGLILATACAIALAMTRDRTRMAHS